MWSVTANGITYLKENKKKKEEKFMSSEMKGAWLLGFSMDLFCR